MLIFSSRRHSLVILLPQFFFPDGRLTFTISRMTETEVENRKGHGCSWEGSEKTWGEGKGIFQFFKFSKHKVNWVVHIYNDDIVDINH